MREIIADTLSRQVQFPDGVIVTVTRIAVSEDLRYAQVFVSVFGKKADDEKAVLDELSKRAGEIQRMLNRKLRMRLVPRITFAIDLDEQRRERVEKLLSGDTGDD